MLLTALGSIFSSLRIYLYVGLAIAALGFFAYVEYLRYEAAHAQANVAGLQATVNVQRGALAANEKTITQLRTADAVNQQAIEEAYKLAHQSDLARQEAEKELENAPKDIKCNGLTARDRAAIDGVRRIINPTPSSPAQH